MMVDGNQAWNADAACPIPLAGGENIRGSGNFTRAIGVRGIADP